MELNNYHKAILKRLRGGVTIYRAADGKLRYSDDHAEIRVQTFAKLVQIGLIEPSVWIACSWVSV